MNVPIEILVAVAAVVVVVTVLLIAVLAVHRRTTAQVEALQTAREADHSPLLLQRQIESLRDQFDRALDTSTQQVNQQLAQVASAVNQRLHENVELIQQTHHTLGERLDNTAQVVGQVHRSLGSLEEASRKIYEIGKDLSSLQQILQAPKLRGGLGELLLEDLLAQILPANHFAVQHAFRSGHKVDAVIKLAGRLVPVDAKFPLENFRRVLDAQSDDDRARARRAFVADVKRHVDAVASKYILPDEDTYDFALMYIPAENVYYEIIVKDDVTGEAHIGDYALARRVIPVSPGSFYAYLQAVVLGLRGLRIEERSHEILAQLSRLRGDFDRFRDDFRLVGKHLGNASTGFNSAERRLERLDARLVNLADSDDTVAVDGAEPTATPLFASTVQGARKG